MDVLKLICLLENGLLYLLVPLGIGELLFLAFWQNEQVQANNDLLMKYERSKMAPIFVAYFDGANGALADIRVMITNISDNVACALEVSPLRLCNANQPCNEYSVKNSKNYLNAHETAAIIFETPITIIQQHEIFEYCFEIKATDIVGYTKKTIVTMKIDAKVSPVFSYKIIDI